jgi:adenine phosphoribosyltransferase
VTADQVAALIRDIPDFPKPGIVFKDVTPVFADPAGLRAAVDAVVGHAVDVGAEYIVSAEARGFVLGGAAASAAGLGFVLGRKPGKLPRETVSVEYELEYGTDVLEVHADAFPSGAPVLVHDDLLATGGTASALCELVERAGARVVGCSFLIELAFLGGRDRLSGREVQSLVTNDSE